MKLTDIANDQFNSMLLMKFEEGKKFLLNSIYHWPPVSGWEAGTISSIFILISYSQACCVYVEWTNIKAKQSTPKAILSCVPFSIKLQTISRSFNFFVCFVINSVFNLTSSQSTFVDSHHITHNDWIMQEFNCVILLNKKSAFWRRFVAD